MLHWQPSLWGEPGAPHVDASFAGLARRDLDQKAWLDHVPGWVTGADALFENLLARADWRAETRQMYGRTVDQPRLTARWRDRDDRPLVPVLADMLTALTAQYERPFDRGGLNLYRDGRDSVAWHGDRIAKEVADPVVAIVSLGSPRTFRLRPKAADGTRGAGISLVLAPGDLLVTGGSCQRTWDHAVPKVASAGPRVSVTFRHG